jgi:O-antigen/teichoic acid export membrane protein
MRLMLVRAKRVTLQIIGRYSHLNLSLIDQIVISGTNFTIGILLARYLGASQFGQFSLIWLMVQFLQAIQNAAIIAPMMSIGPRQNASGVKTYYAVVFSHQLIFASLSAALVAAGMLGSLMIQEWNIQALLLPFSALMFAIQIQEFLRRYFFTVNKPRTSIVIDAIRYVGQTVALLWLFLWSPWQPTIVEVIWTMLIAASVSILAGSALIGKIVWTFSQWQNVSLRHWHTSKWLISTTFVGWMSGELYYVIAGGLLGSSAVGILKSAQTIMGVTNVFFQGMQNYLPIRASVVFREGGMGQLSLFIRKTTFLMTFATSIIAMVLCSYPNHVMEFFYGHQFRDYGWVLVGYAIIYIITALGQAFPVGLLTLERTFATLVAYIVSGFISIVIMYPLVRIQGIAGVLVGLAIYPATQSLVQFIAFKQLMAREQIKEQASVADKNC